MGNSNGKITAPVSLHADVYPVLGLTKTGTFYDIGHANGNSHGQTNKWSNHKPIRYDSPAELTSFDPAIPNSGDHYYAYGMQVDIMHYLLRGYTQQDKITAINTGTEGFLYKLAKGELAAWDYLPPRPGTDWCRLTDWDGYVHDVPDPMPAVQEKSYQLSLAGAVNIPYDDVSATTVPVGHLSLANLLVPSAISSVRPSLRTLYRGMLFYRAALTDVFFLTEETPGEGHVSLANNTRIDLTEHIGAWNVRTFFSSARIDLNDCTSWNSAGYLIPASSTPYTVTLYNQGQPYVVAVDTCKYIDSAHGTVNFVCSVAAYAQNLTLTSISMQAYTAGMVNPWSTLTTFSNTSVTIGDTRIFSYVDNNAALHTAYRFLVTVNGEQETVEAEPGNH